MLFQDDCGGLEVQTRQGEFVKAEPVKGAIIMNIGDLLMRWSNGMDLLSSPREPTMLGMEKLTFQISSNQTFTVSLSHPARIGSRVTSVSRGRGTRSPTSSVRMSTRSSSVFLPVRMRRIRPSTRPFCIGTID